MLLLLIFPSKKIIRSKSINLGADGQVGESLPFPVVGASVVCVHGREEGRHPSTILLPPFCGTKLTPPPPSEKGGRERKVQRRKG